MDSKEKTKKRTVRRIRIRGKIKGTAERPRFSVFRSNKHIVLQLIDDEKGKTILQVSDMGVKKNKAAKTEVAKLMGKELGEGAKKKKIKKVVFDRGGYIYHGRIKAAAEGARESGLEF